jgi:hypothetical protein
MYWPRKGVSMKTLTSLVASALLGVGVIASAQINMPDPSAPGGSMDTAVRVIAANDLMIDRFITRWLRAHYPGWDADPYEVQELGTERYAVVYIRSPDKGGRRVYFRLQRNQSDPDESSPFPGM